MKNVLLFPGQGTQFKGMGRELFENYPDLTEKASKMLGYSIKEICLHNPNGLLDRTDYTQPAIFFVNALFTLKCLPKHYSFTLGHSLGEFNALHFSGAFDIFTGLKIVQKRGELMHKTKSGSMAIVIGLKLLDILKIIQVFGFDEIYIANINTQKQIVISGDTNQINEFKVCANKAKILPLNTSGAFHSPFMSEAKEHFKKYLENIEIQQLRIPVIANYHGKIYNKDETKDCIVNQLVNSVQWKQSIETLFSLGADSFCEVGEKKILTRMVEDIKIKIGK